MSLRTADQYMESLRDGRRVHYSGQVVDDVTTHPVLSSAVDSVADDFRVAHLAEETPQRLLVDHDGPFAPASAYFRTPRNAADLMRRQEIISWVTHTLGGLPFGKEIGSDCVNAVLAVTRHLKDTSYCQRAEQYLQYLRRTDAAMCGAVTDAKGDRRKWPSDQRHSDYYLRVVGRVTDGIVVRGCKLHVTSAPVANEIVVLPSRQLREQDQDYAVAFAIPVSTSGITLICRSGRAAVKPDEFPTDMPVRTLTEAMVVFDDVLVPWERVFLCGEWQAAMPLVYTFASFHRFTAAVYKITAVELLAGCAVALAEANGVAHAGHVRAKLGRIATYVEILKALTRTAAREPRMIGEIAVPSPLATNLAKLHFAEGYHAIVQMVQDIAGGIVSTVPSYQDWLQPELRSQLERYLGGADGVSTEDRLRLIHEARRWIASAEASHMEVVTLHAEGSMEAERHMVQLETPMREYGEFAKRLAGVGGKPSVAASTAQERSI